MYSVLRISDTVFLKVGTQGTGQAFHLRAFRFVLKAEAMIFCHMFVFP